MGVACCYRLKEFRKNAWSRKRSRIISILIWIRDIQPYFFNLNLFWSLFLNTLLYNLEFFNTKILIQFFKSLVLFTSKLLINMKIRSHVGTLRPGLVETISEIFHTDIFGIWIPRISWDCVGFDRNFGIEFWKIWDSDCFQRDSG